MNNNSANTAHTGDPTGMDFHLDAFGSMDGRIVRALLDVPSVARAVDDIHTERYLKLTGTHPAGECSVCTWIPEGLLYAVHTVRMEAHFYECLDDYAIGEETREDVQAELDYLVELLDADDAGIYTPWVVEAVDGLYTADHRYAGASMARDADFLDVFESMDDGISTALLGMPSVARVLEKIHAERYPQGPNPVEAWRKAHGLDWEGDSETWVPLQRVLDGWTPEDWEGVAQITCQEESYLTEAMRDVLRESGNVRVVPRREWPDVLEVNVLLDTLDLNGIPVTDDAVHDTYRLDLEAFLNKWMPLGTTPGGEA